MGFIEREKLVSQMTKHEILMTEKVKQGIQNPGTGWFGKVGIYHDLQELIYKPSSIMHSRIPSLEACRALTAHYLGIATHPETFFNDKRFDKPLPTEEDRLLYSDYLEFQISMTGVLNLSEMQSIRDRKWWDFSIESMPTELMFQKDTDLHSFKQVCRVIKKWKNEGWYIALFHGSFDPPTITHLQNLTTAYRYSSITGVPLKFIVGFDSDELIRERKGKNRPRFKLRDRRTGLGKFWMVDETVELRPKKPETKAFVRDFKDLGIDYVVITQNEEEREAKLPAVLEAGIEIIPIPESPLQNATQILKDVGFE